MRSSRTSIRAVWIEKESESQMERVQEKMGREKFDQINMDNSRSFTVINSKGIGW